MSSLSRLGGGLVSSASHLAQSLARKSRVKIFGWLDEFTEADGAAWLPLNPQAFPVSGPHAFGYAPSLGKALRTDPVDILHTHGLWTYPSVATRHAHKPYLVSAHGMLDAWALQNSRWKKRMAGWFFENAHLRRAACLHALCPAEAEAFRAYGLTNPICVIPNGVDLPEELVEGDPPWSRSIPSDHKVLLYLGRLHPKKGLLNLLHAWSDSQSHPWHLVIAGWDQGGYETELRELTRRLGLEKSVHLSGPLFGTSKSAAYRGADAFILPSYSEGLPMVVLEAWAYSKAVLMTRECNLSMGFEAQAALEIRPSQDGIAEGLRSLFSIKDEAREKMGLRGKELVATHFNWVTIADQMHAVYEWVLGGGKPSSILE